MESIQLFEIIEKIILSVIVLSLFRELKKEN